MLFDYIMQLRLLPSLFLLAFIAPLGLIAQDVAFSQFYANPIYLNPAFAGSSIGPRVTMNYRNQWPSLAGDFVTYSASYDQFVPSLYGGVGIQVMSDRMGAGSFKSTHLALVYSNHLKLSRSLALKTGFQYQYAQRSLNWQSLIFPDQIDARTGVISGVTSEILPNQGLSNANMHDFSAGMMIHSEKVFFGGSVHHLTEPNQSLIPEAEVKWPRRYTAHAGMNIELPRTSYRAPATVISPNLIYMSQGPSNQLNVGAYVHKGPIVGGLWFRAVQQYQTRTSTATGLESMIFLLGLQQGVFRFGYSYDMTTSALKAAALGSHEISLGIQLEPYDRGRGPRRVLQPIPCPKF